MPEQEELRLVVTLDDQASASLGNLRSQLQSMAQNVGGATGVIGGKAKETGTHVKALHSELSSLASRAGFIGGVIGGITSEFTKLGLSIVQRATDLQGLSREFVEMGHAAHEMGTSTAQLRSDLLSFREVGVPIEQAKRNLLGFSDAMADLTLVNGRLRSELLTGGFLDLQKMQQTLARSDAAKTVQEQQSIWRAAGKDVRDYWTALAGPQEGARRERQFYQALGAPDLARIRRDQQQVAAWQKDMDDRRQVAAEKYLETTVDTSDAYVRIGDAAGGLLLELDKIVGASEKWKQFVLDVAVGVEKTLSIVQQEGFSSAFNPFNPNAAKRERELHPERYDEPKWMQDLKRSPWNPFAPGATATEQAHPYIPGVSPVPPATGAQHFMGGAGGEAPYKFTAPSDAQNILGHAPLSSMVEDRRALDDNTQQTDELTEEIRRLNEAISLGPLATQMGGLAPGLGGGGGLAGALGMGAIGRGGGGGFAGGGGGGGLGVAGGGGGGGLGVAAGGGGVGGGGGGGAGAIDPNTGMPVMGMGSGAPTAILKKAQEVAAMGGPGAVGQFMRSQGYPMNGAWCFTGDVEILTSRGFVRFDLLEDGAIVAQADVAGTISFVPSEKIEKNFDGDVFDVNHRSIKLTCEAEHRWYGYWNREATPRFGTLREVTVNGLSIDAVRASDRDASFTDDELQFAAAFISDGSLHGRTSNYVVFEVSKSRKIAALSDLGGIGRQNKNIYGRSTQPLTIFRFALPIYFTRIFDGYKQLRSDFINALSVRQAEIFLNAYAVFDGHYGRGLRTLYTSNMRIRDDLIRIALAAGYYPTIGVKQSPLSDRPCWEVRMSRRGKRRFIAKKHLKLRRFIGRLYCVTVPEGRIIVRGSNGSPVLTGNCGEFAASVVKASGGTPPSNPQVASNWRNWGTEVPTPQAGDIAVRRQEFHGRLGSGRTGEAGSHVTFVGGVDQQTGQFTAIGGNQGRMVTQYQTGRYQFFRGAGPEAQPMQGGQPGAGGDLAGQLGIGAIPTVGAGGAGALQADRQKFAQEMQDPNVQRHMAALLNAEVPGSDPRGQQALVETIFNRASARSQSLMRTMQRDYYEPMRTGAFGRQMAQLTPGRLQALQGILGNVAAGSNVGGLATGNASGGVGFAGGPQTIQTASRERFGIEGADVRWARQMAQRIAQGGPAAMQQAQGFMGQITGQGAGGAGGGPIMLGGAGARGQPVTIMGVDPTAARTWAEAGVRAERDIGGPRDESGNRVWPSQGLRNAEAASREEQLRRQISGLERETQRQRRGGEAAPLGGAADPNLGPAAGEAAPLGGAMPPRTTRERLAREARERAGRGPRGGEAAPLGGATPPSPERVRQQQRLRELETKRQELIEIERHKEERRAEQDRRQSRELDKERSQLIGRPDETPEERDEREQQRTEREQHAAEQRDVGRRLRGEEPTEGAKRRERERVNPDDPAKPGRGGDAVSGFSRGSALDKGQDVKVTADGSLKVDVNAPPGTKVSAEGNGLFKKKTITRSTQMEPAESGPTHSANQEE